MITPEIKTQFDRIVEYYPPDQRQAAVIPLLHLLQSKMEGNCLPVEAQSAVADYLGMPLSKVHEVVSFYGMFSEKPRGRFHLMLCHTLPCALAGCDTVAEVLRQRLGPEGQVTADGRFSWEQVECLARCGEGPVLQVGGEVFTELTAEKTSRVLDELQARR